MTYAIKAENLGKRYLIGHQRKESYSTLRDAISHGVKNLANRILHPQMNSSGSELEEFWALHDVSFEIQPGDRVGIIGRNGAGKSTLLKILSRITEPTTGRFTTRGRVAALLEVGTGFHPELSGRENIYLNGAILGMSRSDVKRQFDAIVEFAGVEKFLDTPVKRYSSGMYVRLAFAVAAHLEPDILIVDEVLAVGDAEFQKKCLGKMEEVGKEGRTVVFVSHNMSAVRRLCDKGMVMEGGGIIKNGNIADLISHIQSRLSNQESLTAEFNPLKIAQFQHVEIQNENSLLRITITYEVLSEEISASIAIKLTSSNMVDIFTILDTDSHPEISQKVKGLYSYHVNVPIDSLAPDLFYLTFSISDMKSERYDFIDKGISFTIYDDPHYIVNSYNGRQGIIIPDAKWIRIS